ncbi:AbrB family transcriptional regulator [Paenibacillus sp. GD4]|uniref:AbrB family transcriptional regulator n=1 Tax=Paenibacillus sp. GD4 TaxID=3068890 RepID=UPI002796D0F8|nr:AbrB family transcriptional regulator [Paenibacillus sp. GD4]MDQ1909604.1 AbrB family transcriptional regulator [Paenibacillus sp. GD4]
MLRFLETVLITVVFGLLFTWLRVPLSWMLGPLAGVLLWTGFTRRQLSFPLWLRNVGLVLLGYAMGLAFTADSARQIVTQLPWMLLATVLTVGFSLLMAGLLTRFTGIDAASSAIGSIPGGLSQMVVLAEEVQGADQTVVAFLQTIRLLTVIFVVPFLAVHSLSNGPGADLSTSSPASASSASSIFGEPYTWVLLAGFVLAAALLSVRLKLPTPWFLGPLAAAALLTVSGYPPPHLPSPMILAAQWCLGVYLGLGIKLTSLAGWRRLLPLSVISGLFIVGFSLALSFWFSSMHPMSVATAFLGTSPGGMTEMGVTATTVHADVSLVVAYQMFRILFILFVVPYGLRWAFRARSTRPENR